MLGTKIIGNNNIKR